MPYRSVFIPAIALFFLVIIAGTFLYGPARRSYVYPEKTVTARSSGEIERIWSESGVTGRIAVVFAQHLNLLSLGSSYPDSSYLDTAMRHGIVRKALYVVPDRSWAQISSVKNMGAALIAPPQDTDRGFFILHEGGRIYTMPLSKYNPIREKALVVFEPAAWSPEDRSRIDHLFKIGFLSTDLLVVVEGRENPPEQDMPEQESFHH